MSGIEFARTKFAPEENLPERWRNLPQLSIEERDRRWWAIQEKMSMWEIDALLVWDLSAGEYLTHVPPRQGPVIFPLEGEPIVTAYVRPFDKYMHYGVGQFWTKDVRGRINVAKEIKKLGLERGKLGDVGRRRNKHHAIGRGIREHRGFGYHKLVQDLPEAEFVDATSLVEEVREIASPELIKQYEKSAEIQNLVFDEVKKIIKPGVKECEIVAKMIETEIAAGGKLAQMPFISAGPYPLMHGSPPPYSTYTLKQGDLVIYEFHSQYGQAYLGTQHSYSLGEPCKEYKEIAEVCEEVWKKGHASIVVGATFDEVWEAMRSPCEKAGLEYIEIGFHDAPNHNSVMYPPDMMVDWVDEPMKRKVRAGMVIIHNIDIYNQKFKESILHFGDTTLVMDIGPRKMSKIPMELTIL